MIEAASKLKLEIYSELVQRFLFAYNWNLDMEKAFNDSFDVELLEFGLIMQINEEIDVVYIQNSRWIWTRFWSHLLHMKTRLI